MVRKNTSIITLNNNNNKLIINQILYELNNNNIVLIPTETVYGLVSKITKESIIKTYNIKKRSLLKPFSIIIGNIDSLNKLVSDVPNYVWYLIDRYWPGPLTIIFKINNNNIISKIIGKNNTIGIRMPNHNFVLELLNKSGPLICTSANISGKKDPSSINQVDPEIKLNVSIIIDDDVIKSGMPSTILDVTNKEPLFLREGTIKYEDIIKKIDEYNNLK